MTPETVDLDRYYAPDELAAMPPDTLEELWKACPDRPFYEAALDQAVADTYGAGDPVSDLDRLGVIERCIELYGGQPPRIPVLKTGDGEVKWFRVSDRVVGHLRSGRALDTPRQAEGARSMHPRLIAALIGIGLTLMCLAATLIRRSASSPALSAADLTVTAAVEMGLALLPQETPTPTPLALEHIDRPIQGGDDLRGIYPVLLEITPAGGAARVFPVQQKAVAVAEWDYAADPDVASAILGLVIRPVLGIPYTPANAAFLEGVRPGDGIDLRMSTGQTLHFTVTGGERVNRQEVAIFDQSTPGIVLVLLGDPAGDRLVIHGSYPTGQEVGYPAGDVPLSGVATAARTGQPVEHGDTGVTLTVLEAYPSAGQPGAALPAEWVYLLVDLRISARNGADTGSFHVEAIAPTGARYAPVAVDGAFTHHTPFAPVQIGAGQEVHMTVAFLVPRSLVAATLRVQVSPDSAPVAYQLSYTPLTTLNASDLDVLLLEVAAEGTPDEPLELVAAVRFFNPLSAPITVRPGEVVAVFSPLVLEDAFPVGPTVQPRGARLPLTVEPGQAVDVTFRFAWSGEPCVGIDIAGYRYLVVLREGGE